MWGKYFTLKWCYIINIELIQESHFPLSADRGAFYRSLIYKRSLFQEDGGTKKTVSNILEWTQYLELT